MKLLLPVLVFIIGCSPTNFQPNFVAPPKSRQVLIVSPKDQIPLAEVTAWARAGDAWSLVRGPYPCVVGSRGVAAIGAKREGDKCTPAGFFPLVFSFGYEPSADTRLTYRQATKNDFWIDAPESPDYNRWINGPKPSCSHEILRRTDEQYRLAAVIGYNLDPVVPGRGSAIFMHIWRSPGHGTDGCVAMSSDHLTQILNWLDQKAEPQIIIGPAKSSQR